MKDRNLGDKIILPQSMMKSDEEIFLDDYTVVELEEKLGVPIQISEVEGKRFIQAILNSKNEV